MTVTAVIVMSKLGLLLLCLDSRGSATRGIDERRDKSHEGITSNVIVYNEYASIFEPRSKVYVYHAHDIKQLEYSERFSL